MRLAFLVAATFAFCSAAQAANPNWTTVSGGTECKALAPGRSCAFEWTSAANANSGYLDVYGHYFSCRLEPHVEGTDTDAQADVYGCVGRATAECTALQWDTDANSIVDDNTLDSDNVSKIGTPVFMGLPFIYVDPIANPTTGTARVVCTGGVN